MWQPMTLPHSLGLPGGLQELWVVAHSLTNPQCLNISLSTVVP